MVYMEDKQGSFLQNWSEAIIKHVVEMSEPSGGIPLEARRVEKNT